MRFRPDLCACEVREEILQCKEGAHDIEQIDSNRIANRRSEKENEANLREGKNQNAKNKNANRSKFHPTQEE